MAAILYFAIEVVKGDIGGKCDCGYSKTRKQAGEHGTIGEHGVFPPCFSLGPRITEKWRVGHAIGHAAEHDAERSL